MFDADGASHEFQSKVLPRYARRTERVDEAILSAYLGGVNTRRVRLALEPLLGTNNLSKSAVSRVTGHLKALFASWDNRDLHAEFCPIVILDAINLKVRLARRVVSTPVLVVQGISADGVRRVVALRLAASEAATCWGDLISDLQRRGMPAPQLVITDGHRGLTKALARWPDTRVQRCTVHKRRNLMDHCPAHAQREVRREYDRIVNAADGTAALKEYEAFITKWSRLCPPVARSLADAGHELITYYQFPRALWRAIRTTNSIENLNREFRRRTKTQASFSTEAAALTLLFGLLAFGQIPTRKIDGHFAIRDLLRDDIAVAA
jgi:transposase-like protein